MSPFSSRKCTILVYDKSGLTEVVMKRLALVLSAVFIILTFAGSGYIIFNDGNASAGYACVPMVFTLISLSFYQKYK